MLIKSLKYFRHYFKFFLLIMVLFILSDTIFFAFQISKDQLTYDYQQFSIANQKADFEINPNINELKMGITNISIDEYNQYHQANLNNKHDFDFSKIKSIESYYQLTDEEKQIIETQFNDAFLNSLQNANEPATSIYFKIQNYLMDRIEGSDNFITEQIINEKAINDTKLIMNFCLDENDFSYFIAQIFDIKILNNQAIKDKYDMSIYKNETINLHELLDSSEVTYCVSNVLKDVNKPYIIQSLHSNKELILLSHEIAVNEEFAKLNNLKLGDTLTIANRNYVISAFVYLPHLIYPITNDNYYFNSVYSSVVLMNDTDLNEMILSTNTYHTTYFIKFDHPGDSSRIAELYQDIDHHTNMISIDKLLSDEMINRNLSMMSYLDIIIPIIIFTITLVFYGLFMSLKLDENKNELSILRALGYHKYEITFFISLITLFIAIVSMIISLLLGFLISRYILHFYYQLFLLPHQVPYISLLHQFYGLLLPFLFMLTITFIISQRFLIRLNKEKSSTPRFIIKFKKMNITNKIKISLTIRNLKNIIYFCIIIFLASFAILFSLSTNTLVSQYKGQLKQIYEVKQIVYYPSGVNLTNQFVRDNCETGECEGFTTAQLNIDYKSKNTTIQFEGIDTSQKLIHLINQNNRDLSKLILDDNIIITKLLSEELNIKINDQINVTTNIISTSNNGKTCTFNDLKMCEVQNMKVVGITNNTMETKVYGQLSTINQMYFGDSSHPSEINSINLNFNIYKLSKNNPLLTNITFVFNYDDVEANLNKTFYTVDILLQFSFIIFIILSIILTSILTYLNIANQTRNIALFKSIGYEKKEISKMLFSLYKYCLILTFLITIPLSKILVYNIFYYMGKSFDKLIIVGLSLSNICFAFIILNTVYILVYYITKYFINKISVSILLTK